MTAKEYATTLKGKSITAAYIGPLRLLQNAEMDSTYLPEVIEDPERDQVYYTGNLGQARCRERPPSLCADTALYHCRQQR